MSESAFLAPETNDNAVTFEDEGDHFVGITQFFDQQFPIGHLDTRLSSNAASSSAGPKSTATTSTTPSTTTSPAVTTSSPANSPDDSRDSMPTIYTVCILYTFLNSHISHVR